MKHVRNYSDINKLSGIVTSFRKETMGMFKNLLMIMAVVSVLLLSSCSPNDNVPPKVIGTNPPNGAQSVDPSLTELSVIFNEPMMDKNWSWAYEDKDTFPQMTGQPYYSEDNTKNSLPVKLEPNKEYVIWINTVNFKNFKDKAGNPVEPYRFTFKTR